MYLPRSLPAAAYALLVVASLARGESCQNVASIVVETPPSETALGVLQLDDGPGVDCEIDLFGVGRDAYGAPTGAPPADYSEVYAQHSPAHIGLSELSRELAIRGVIGLSKVTVYRQWFTGSNDSRVGVADIVVERTASNERRLQLWWRAPMLSSAATNKPRKLIDLPYGAAGTAHPCARGSASGCVRTRWVHGNGGATVTFELSSGSQLQKVELILPNNRPLPPTLALGYVEATQGPDLAGSLSLRHRLCQVRTASFSADWSNCTPRMAWEVYSTDPEVAPNGIVSVRAQVSNTMPYTLHNGVWLVIDNIPSGRFRDAAGQGWYCRDEWVEYRNQLWCSHGGSIQPGPLPELLMQFNAGPLGGFHETFWLRYADPNGPNELGEQTVIVSAPGAP